MPKAIDCHKCEHYYVTWENEFPYGCKAMGFKSKRLPCIDVRVSSYRACLLMEKKKKQKREERGWPVSPLVEQGGS